MKIRIVSETWKGRSALRLRNGIMEAVLLRGGGHLAELRLSHEPAINCLWVAPWQTADPTQPEFSDLAARYGSAPAGPFLAGYTGHALCLDTFGPPSAVEATLGVPLHGEAAVQQWNFISTTKGCLGKVDLPVAQLKVERTITLAEEAPILFVEEHILNHGQADRRIQWVQHVSLGPPFLVPDSGRVDASVDRAMTWPLGYEGHELLPDSTAFQWPQAPVLGGGTLDLRIPFQRAGFGFVAGARVDPARKIAYISALNLNIGIALIYCFRCKDFPWIAVWEENRARTAPPWDGSAQVRGMEFGTTPMAIGRNLEDMPGMLFDTPTSRILRPGEKLHGSYVAAIAHVPQEWRAITDVQCHDRTLTLIGPTEKDRIALVADGLQRIL